MTSAANPPTTATSKPKAAPRVRAKAAAATPAAAPDVVAAPVAPAVEATPVAPAIEATPVAPSIEATVEVPAPVVEPAAPVAVVAPVVVEAVAAAAAIPLASDAAQPVLAVVSAVSTSAQDNLEALLRASEALSQGFQDLGQVVWSLTQDSIDDSVALSRRIMAIKSLPELVEVQASLMHTQLDRMVSEGTRLSELSMKLAEATTQPLSERINLLVDRLVRRAA